jgi:2-aminoadipate transaminase
VLLDPGDAVGVETPTYLGALQALGQYFPRFVSLPGDEGGLLPDQVEHTLLRALGQGSPAKMVYAIPSFQNPTGRTLTLQRRMALVEACERLQVPLIEDDPYGALDHGGHKHISCLSLAGANVLYLGSFSKILSPGIRLGFMVAPLHIARRLELAKQASDLHSSSLMQRVVFEIVKGGFLTRHLAACQALYRANAQAMAGALEHHLNGLALWTIPAGGMFQWLELTGDVDAEQLLEQALEAGVAYVPGAPFYAESPRKNTVRLCFSTVSAQDIATGAGRLAGVLRERRDAA